MKIESKTPCLWKYVTGPQKRDSFLSPYYQCKSKISDNCDNSNDVKSFSGVSSSPTGSTVLLPYISTVVRNYSVWSDYFYRWCSVPSYSSQIPPRSRPEGTLTEFVSGEKKMEVGVKCAYASAAAVIVGSSVNDLSERERFVESALTIAQDKIKELEAELIRIKSLDKVVKDAETDKIPSENSLLNDTGNISVNLSVGDLDFESDFDKDPRPDLGPNLADLGISENIDDHCNNSQSNFNDMINEVDALLVQDNAPENPETKNILDTEKNQKNQNSNEGMENSENVLTEVYE